MNINIEPLNDRLLILPDPKREKTEGGIIIPETVDENYIQTSWGVVRRVSGKLPEYKSGDRVMFPSGAGTEQKINGTTYRSIRDGDIWAKEIPEHPTDKL